MNEQQRDEFVKKWMPLADELAREMDDGRIPIEDLIQEAYVGLSEALSKRDGSETPEEDLVEESIRSAIRKAKEEYSDQTVKDDKLIQQVELLNKSIDKLTEELGEKPTLDELANDLGISQDKVIDVLKLTGEDYEEGHEEEHEDE